MKHYVSHEILHVFGEFAHWNLHLLENCPPQILKHGHAPMIERNGWLYFIFLSNVWYMGDLWWIHGWYIARHVSFMVHQWIFSLVGGLVATFYVPIYWVANHPNWLSYSWEGWPNHQPVLHVHYWLKDLLTPMTCSTGVTLHPQMNPGWLIRDVRSICYHNLPLVGSIAVHIYMYIYIFLHIHTYICIYIYMYVYMYVYIVIINFLSEHPRKCPKTVSNRSLTKVLTTTMCAGNWWDLTVCQWWVAHSPVTAQRRSGEDHSDGASEECWGFFPRGLNTIWIQHNSAK